MTVRIIIPVYNREALLGDAVASVRSQSHDDWNLLIVDDGSTDATAEVALELASRDSRIRVVRQGNAGAAAARNRGLREPGEYAFVAFLDSDDIWHSDHLADSLRLFHRWNGLGLTFARFATTDRAGRAMTIDDGTREGRMVAAMKLSGNQSDSCNLLIDQEELLGALLDSRVCPATPTVVIRSNALGGLGFDADLSVMEDLSLWIALAYRGVRFGFIDRIRTTVRLCGDNLTRRLELRDPDFLSRQEMVHRFNHGKRKYCRTRLHSKMVAKHLAESAYVLGQSLNENSQQVRSAKAYIESIWYGGGWPSWRSLLGLPVPEKMKQVIRGSYLPRLKIAP